MQKYQIKDSKKHGLGVFATQDFKSGDIIERCPYIVIDDEDLQEENRLNDYLFTSPDCPTDYLVMMGVGMISTTHVLGIVNGKLIQPIIVLYYLRLLVR